MTNHPNRTHAALPANVIEKTRDFCFGFSAGEWEDNKVIEDFIRQEFNYSGSTPEQFTQRFIKRGVANNDFETRWRQWRWIVHA